MSPAAYWSATVEGCEPDLLARTVFAAVLAIATGSEDVRLTCGTEDAGEQPQVEELQVVPQVALRALSHRWVSAPAAGTGSLAALRRQVSVGGLPAFRYAGDGQAPLDLLSPLSCVVRTVPEGLEWTFTARKDAADPGLLHALAAQAATMWRALGDDPDVTVEQVGRTARSLAFEIQVLGVTGPAVEALHAWGQAVGLPVSARRVEPEDVGLPTTVEGGLQPASWGANLAVLGRALGALPQPRPARAEHEIPSAAWGTLPDGHAIAEMHRNESRELYDEIVVRNQYLRYGLQVCDGDVVVDVGANVGVFALFAAAQATRVTVHAFEPVPAVAQALEANMSLYGISGTVTRAAIGASAGTSVLTFYPQSSLQSGFYTDADRDQHIVREYARHQAESLPGLPVELRAVAAEALAPTALARTAERQEIAVPVIRLSDWIRDNSVGRIHLLKVDAERAEEDVLAGIDDAHWPLIDQVVAEVHDIDGRVERLRAMLQSRGFETVVDQDALFAGSEIHMLYGLRRPGVSRPEAPWLGRQVEAAERWAATSALPLYVTVAPGASAAESRQARRAVEARGLTWVEPPPSCTPAGASAEGSQVVLPWAEAVLRRTTAAQRPVAKAVVVDGDNTLWGGVCGEIGPENVDAGGPYRQVQEFLREQLEAGRVLCLCSRNNLADVEAVFAAHPDMPLGLGDFVSVRVGWGPKSTAISEIADELGFAVESLVFVDDSAAERAEVAIAHPGITVVDLPADPREFPAALNGTWQLDLEGTGTAEDRARTGLIAVEARRRRAAAQTATTSEYLEQLDLQVEVSPATEDEVERIAQLAARTTQFNLALRSHTPGTVRQVLAGTGVALSVRVRDRFGDYGLVGFVSAEADGRVLRVRDLFVSCRALGRNVEWCILRELAEQATALALVGLALTGTPGPRNRPALEFADTARTRYSLAGTPDLVDASAAAALEWRLLTTPQTAAAPAAGGLPAAGAPSQVRWPVSQQAAALAADAYRRPGETASTTPYVAPQTETERRIAEVWEETLKVGPIGVHDDLFTLGCDSLTAAVICARLRRHGVDLAVHELLAQPTVRRAARHAGARKRSAIELPADEDAGPASLGQQRIWAAEAVGGCGNAQVIPVAHQITGPLDLGRLRSALAAAVARHPALRTVLVDDGGTLVQRRLTAQEVDIELSDLSSLPETDRAGQADLLAHRFFQAPFDVGRDLMVRAAVLRLAPDDHVLLLMLHHSAADGWSVDVLQRDLGAAYTDPQALASAPADATFAQYSAAAVRRRESGAFDQGMAAVRAALKRTAARPWSTPTGLPVEPRHLRFALDADLVASARAAARSRSATPVAVHLAAWQVLLAAAAGTDAVVTGCPVAGRTEEPFTDTIGFFANLVAIPAHIDWSATAGGRLDTAVAAAAEALSHAEVPYGMVADGAGAVFDTLFTLQPPATHPLRLPGCTVAWSEPALWPVPYPLMLDVQEHADGASALLRFNAHAHHPVDPPWLAEAYPLVLAALSTLPELPMQRLRDLLQPGTATVHDLVRDRLANLREDGEPR
ncbi:FkbM family methyltransferase [Kitasatospora sp. NPDC048296]|uniref:FkbM family methyltransferase n=1 Tax=Kitasatospora sp. NPDC048296 TaxID=3364048 RepID=UPI00371FD05C